ncbi:hypothetical protein FD45_GL000912 [Liquorilactobacillus nagelii DSM 13675]|nr:hypothetical protein FD45_GL000912 [Liquorilactobacillus nagelii DSM 13675]
MTNLSSLFSILKQKLLLVQSGKFSFVRSLFILLSNVEFFRTIESPFENRK